MLSGRPDAGQWVDRLERDAHRICELRPGANAINGLVLTQALWEPTLGQILSSLGYKLNVGLAQNNANPNRGKTVQELPGVEASTDEVAAPLFVKAGSGNVTLTVAARFSPKGPLPSAGTPRALPTKRNTVATMDPRPTLRRRTRRGC